MFRNTCPKMFHQDWQKRYHMFGYRLQGDTPGRSRPRRQAFAGASTLWHIIPQEVKLVPTLSTFHKFLKSWLGQQAKGMLS